MSINRNILDYRLGWIEGLEALMDAIRIAQATMEGKKDEVAGYEGARLIALKLKEDMEKERADAN